MLNAFSRFLSCIRNWMSERKIPIAYTYCHEVGARVGLHSHVSVFIPGRSTSRPLRSEFRAWARDWVKRQTNMRIGRVVRVRGPSIETPWLHWLAFNYQMKGYDRSAVVCSERHAVDRHQVLLGDLVAFRWRNPGVILSQRCGHARGLGSRWRIAGIHPELQSPVRSTARVVDPFADEHIPCPSPTRIVEPHRSFRSKYEDGARDVWSLYGDDFCERVLGIKNPRTLVLNVCDASFNIDEVLNNLGI